MQIYRFLRENARWIGGGFLLTYFSAFGQTYFISLSAGHIRDEYGLTNGGFGMLYMLATLASALTLPRLGQIVDRRSASKVTLLIVPMLAFATVLMSMSHNVALLFVTVYLLRLFGQGMMTHTSLTAMGRWFSAQRGRAISLVSLGQNVGEASFPLIFVGFAAAVGWRSTWLLGTAILLLIALPAIALLVGVERAPKSSDPVPRLSSARDWTRAEVLRDPIFYMMLLGVMAPAFISTTIMFHQIYLVDLRGWSLELFASAFTLSATTTIVFSLVAGYLIDRFSGVALLPGFLLPMAAACLVLGSFQGQWSAFAFMGLLGISNGFSSTLSGALWPELYGVRHLGSIRALVVAIMVLASAIGPGLTGYLIDTGVSFPGQIIVMGLYCLFISVVMFYVSRNVRVRALSTSQASVTPQI